MAELPWIDHDGGGRPHPPGDYVEIARRDGTTAQERSALVRWMWGHNRKPDDIVMWRPAEEPIDVGTAARALVVKLDACAPHVADAFLHRQLRCGLYDGPTYEAELAALKTALGLSR